MHETKQKLKYLLKKLKHKKKKLWRNKTGDKEKSRNDDLTMRK